MSTNDSRNTFGIALFGIGRIGTVHFGNLCRNPRAIVRYVLDEDVERAKATVKASRMENSVTVLHPDDQDRALGDKSVHAVIVCTPTFSHEEIIRNALKHEKSVFCEKPVSLSLEGIKQCYALAERANKPLLSAFNRRMDPSHANLQQRLVAGEAGKIHMVKICSRDYPRNHLSYLQISGGIFHDCSIHDIDMVCWLLGEFPATVYVQAHAHHEDIAAIPDVDTVVIVMKFPSGAIAIIDNSREAAYGYDQRMEVFGSKGMLVSQNQPINSVESLSASGITGSCIKASCMKRYMDSYSMVMEHFLDVLAGKELSFKTSQVISAAVIADACVESYKKGGPVSLTWD